MHSSTYKDNAFSGISKGYCDICFFCMSRSQGHDNNLLPTVSKKEIMRKLQRITV